MAQSKTHLNALGERLEEHAHDRLASIVLVTCGRESLFRRTIDSLSKCHFPSEIAGGIVCENGATRYAEPVLAKFSIPVPMRVLRRDDRSKSRALNQGLHAANTEWAIFFDDDIRCDEPVLAAYVNRMKQAGPDVFLGGCCLADWEVPPEEWLLPFLPLSARGLEFRKDGELLAKPVFLGANWAARVSEVLALGGFNESLGPGTRFGGEETDVMERLHERGLRGSTVSGAKVWHWVPRHRCTPDWALQRIRARGRVVGRSARLSGGFATHRKDILPMVRFCAREGFSIWRQRLMGRSRRLTFEVEARVARVRGMLSGFLVP